MSGKILSLAVLTLGASISCAPAKVLNPEPKKQPTTVVQTDSEDEVEEKPLYVTIEDFLVVEEIPLEEVKSLEEVLDAKPSVAKESLKSQYPEIAYCVSLEGDIPSLETTGSTFILNDKGFLITAYHVFEECMGKDKRLILIYDPVHNFVSSARPLIFSGEYDILLGKLDADLKFHIETARIAKSDKTPLDIVYSVTYDDMDYAIGTLFQDVIKRAGIDGSSKVVYEKDLFDGEEHLDRLNVAVLDGPPKDLDLDVKYNYMFKEDGKLKEGFYAFSAGAVKGNSGCPTRAFNGHIIGILNHTLPDGEGGIDAIYTGQNVIREMIETYMKL